MSEALVTIVPGMNTKRSFMPADGMHRSFKNRPIRTLQGLEHRVVIPVNEHGLLTSPLEAGTGVPLPILGQRSRFERDMHHAYFYKTLFKETLGAKAVRLSRMQLVGRHAHKAYHKEFDGTRVPENDHEAFKSVILNLAGYVPEIGVDIREEKIRKKTGEIIPAQVVIRSLRNAERFSFRKPGTFSAQQDSEKQKTRLTSFIEGYADSQDFDAMRRLELEEFMDNFQTNSHDQEVRDRQLQLAFRLTAAVLTSAIEKPEPLVAEVVA